MDPAVNRDQAERCLQKAREAYKSGELETARRLASKSNRLCPSSQAQGKRPCIKLMLNTRAMHVVCVPEL